MTVSVTVKTQRWPALVTLTEHAESDEGHESNVADTLIPADTMQTLHIGHLAQLTIREVDPGALAAAIGIDAPAPTGGDSATTDVGNDVAGAATASTSTDTASPAASE